MQEKVNHLIYAADQDLHNSIRLGITLTEPVDPDALRAALPLAAKRFPFFAVKLVKVGEELRFEPNDAPFVVSADGGTVTLGTEESNGHLFAFAYQGNTLYVDLSHFVSDGNGSFQFLKTLLYSYLHILHPEAQFDEESILLPDSPILPAELECDPYPEQPLPVTPLGDMTRPEEILMLHDQPQGYENSKDWTAFRFHIKQKDLMGYASSVDGSPSTFVSSLLFRAVSDLHPENPLPVVCGVQHQFRKALRKPFSHLCHVNIVPIEYPFRLRGKEMMKLNTISRGRLILRGDDENDKLTVNRHIDDDKRIRKMTYAEKRNYMRQVLLDGIGKNTFEVSYTGRVPWSGVDAYITDVSPYLDMTLSGGISAEIFTVRDEFCINIMQRSPDSKYFDRVKGYLNELSIPFTALPPEHFAICGLRLPE
ncbi:MAG: hypothetical protein J5851_00875 [Oscillospiraceae bacterium]|nr:hypothetical protein [Oscillospiraceae bacterium]